MLALISGSRVIRNAVDVQLGSTDAGGQKAKGSEPTAVAGKVSRIFTQESP